MAYSLTIFASDLRTRIAGLIVALCVPALISGPGLAQTNQATAQVLSQFEIAGDKTALDATFRSADDRTITLADYRGKVVILNFWATWCAPCIKEMPSLDRAQALLGPDFKVLALSLDAASSRPKVAPFYRDRNLKNLEIYFDMGRQAFQALNVVVLPTTILIDQDGREVGRLQGEADWDSPEALALIRRIATGTH